MARGARMGYMAAAHAWHCMPGACAVQLLPHDGAGGMRCCGRRMRALPSEAAHHSSLPPSTDSAKDMSDGSVSTLSASRNPTRLGYVVRL